MIRIDNFNRKRDISSMTILGPLKTIEVYRFRIEHFFVFDNFGTAES